MKYMLIMIFCSGLNNQCLEPIIINNNYADFKTCIVTGYKFAIDAMATIKPNIINEQLIYYKFICTINPRVET